MFDFIKSQDLSVPVDLLLTNARLTFPLLIDERTAAVLTNRYRRATCQGLIFTLKPNRTATGSTKSKGYTCELTGSLHRYHNEGDHNADDFTVSDLLSVLDDLVTGFGVDPFTSKLNNIEFGVNISLPFPVANVLEALLCYKGIPFIRDSENSSIYYQAKLSHYTVKIYDKGTQFGLPGNLLRVEVKVLKMQYLTGNNINLNTLANLLNVSYYPALGTLLADAFETILFDELTVNTDRLKVRDRDLINKGRSPRYWQLPSRDTFPSMQKYASERKRLQRDEKRFRALLVKHRQEEDWQRLIAFLIRTKWNDLTTISPSLLLAIRDKLECWATLYQCPKFTGSESKVNGRGTLSSADEKGLKFTDTHNGKMSQFYTLNLGKFWDKPGLANQPNSTPLVTRGTLLRTDSDKTVLPDTSTRELEPIAAIPEGESQRPTRRCVVTGINISHQPSRSRFLSANTIIQFSTSDQTLFDELANDYLTAKQRATDDLRKWAYYIAHNIRNSDANNRNNLRRRLKRIINAPELFPIAERIQLNEHYRSLLSYWEATPYDLALLLSS